MPLPALITAIGKGVSLLAAGKSALKPIASKVLPDSIETALYAGGAGIAGGVLGETIGDAFDGTPGTLLPRSEGGEMTSGTTKYSVYVDPAGRIVKVHPARRRRRRRLATNSDLADLAALKATLGSSAEFKAIAAQLTRRR